MKGIVAHVNPAMLAWARRTAGYDLQTAARKLSRPVEQLHAWEAGEEPPSLSQARKAAHLYKRPLSALYLPIVPEEEPAPPDFRRLPAGVPEEFSPELRKLIRLARERQEWAHSILEEEGETPQRWIGSESTRTNSTKLAARIRQWLRMSLERQIGLRTFREALNEWVDAVEECGVFVFQSGGPGKTFSVDPTEARGLALADDLAPLVLMNGKDSYSGRVFTLIHEVVHLWVGAPGLSNREPVHRPSTDREAMEVFCNRTAAQVLIPEDWFLSHWNQKLPTERIPGHVKDLARTLKVSREAMAHRALDLGLISWRRYMQLRTDYLREWAEHRQRQKEKKEGPRDFALLVSKRAGVAFSRMVLVAYQQGRITGRDVSNLLNAKLGHLEALAEHVGLSTGGRHAE